MIKCIKIVLFAALFSALLTCDLFEPEQKSGAIAINFDSQQQLAKGTQSEDTLATVQCVFSKGGTTIQDQSYRKSSSPLKIEFKSLEPAKDYAILLYGKNSENEMTERSYKSDIQVIAGQVTFIDMSWDDFRTTLQTPANGATITSFPIAFSWTSVASVQTYELRASINSNFSSTVLSQQITDSTSLSVSQTWEDGAYYWQVRCQDNKNNWGAWSSIFSFTVNTQGPEAPTLISPADNAVLTSNTPDFDWSDVSGAAAYELVVDNDNSFTSAEISQTDLTASNYTAVTQIADGTYYWRVRARRQSRQLGRLVEYF
ncbi:hypothetical protein EH223_20375 [candidate division KSB1 bacterium]|nr:hypothetical protein [candidate division KSB1 bacterium]RQV99859.1 MAG: hypothetical protein EH223_20375 [candidate division KSB1 bacterium]